MNGNETTITRWWEDAKNLQPGEQINIYLKRDDPEPTWIEMSSVLYTEFGEDTNIRIWKHGPRISIFIPATDEERDRFDARNAPFRYSSYDEKRKEYQNGFVKELP